MDNQTRQTLKQPDQFVTATEQGLDWAHQNRGTAIRYAGILLAVVLVIVGGVVIYNMRQNSAQAAFGDAMVTYQADVDQPGVPPTPGVKTFATVQERAKVAHEKFEQVANKYSMTSAGSNALYFAGLTAIEANQTSTAEADLKKVSESWNGDLASLAKLSLATMYHQTGQDPKAIDLYNQLIAKPTRSVSAPMAQLQLAALYEQKGQTADARKIYAQIKDKEAKTAAGQIADRKLNPAAAAAQAPQM